MKKLTPTGSAIVSSGSGSPSPTRVEHVADVLDEEAVVLEDPEHAEVERDRRAPTIHLLRRVVVGRGAMSRAATWLPSVIAASSRQKRQFAAA